MGWRPMAAMVMAVNELFYAGVDPNEVRFKRFECHDVGVRCDGWGHIVLEMRVEDRARCRDLILFLYLLYLPVPDQPLLGRGGYQFPVMDEDTVQGGQEAQWWSHSESTLTFI